MWYRNLYFLRCVSKPGVEAIGLYASLTNDSPPWHGSHTLNYNSEQTFWASYVSNHVGLAEPYERMVFRYLPRARWFARQTYNCGGAHFPHNIFAHETLDPEKCRSKNNRMHSFPPYAHTIGVSGFVVQNLWHHYKYQPDKKYLEEVAYPAVQVTWFSPEEEKSLFVHTIETVKWTGYNSSIILSVARARLSMPDTWRWVKETLLFRSRPNGTITLRPGDACGHFTEQFAASMAVSELLIQSVGDIIRVFPAWPREKSARFENLRAQGGFLVSAEQSDGRIKEIIVISTVGGHLRILDPWASTKIIERDTQPGQRLVFHP